MANELTVYEEGGFVTELEEIEHEINAAAYEAFYFIGQRLLKIRKKRLYEQADFKSWSAYCAAGRIEFGKRQADNYIRASELRPTLGKNLSHEFTQWQMLELCKCETDQDAKRVAKRAIAHAKKTGERVTAKLIATIRDGETTKPEKELESASLDQNIEKLATVLVNWRTSLEQIEPDFWESVSDESMTRVVAECRALLKFLRS